MEKLLHESKTIGTTHITLVRQGAQHLFVDRRNVPVEASVTAHYHADLAVLVVDCYAGDNSFALTHGWYGVLTQRHLATLPTPTQAAALRETLRVADDWYCYIEASLCGPDLRDDDRIIAQACADGLVTNDD